MVLVVKYLPILSHRHSYNVRVLSILAVVKADVLGFSLRAIAGRVV